MLNKRADKLELIRIAEAVALEKSIDKELIISSMETGIAKSANSSSERIFCSPKVTNIPGVKPFKLINDSLKPSSFILFDISS